MISRFKNYLLTRPLRRQRPGTIGRDARRSRARLGFENLEDRAVPAATVMTELLDYSPGEVINVSGTGYAAGETINLSIHLNGKTEVANWTVTDGGTGDLDGVADGSFQSSILCGNWEDSFEILSAAGLSSGEVATAVFTDSGQGSPPNISAQLGWLGADVGDQPTYTVTAPEGYTITKIGIKAGQGASFPIENLTGVLGDANTSSKHSPVIVADGTYSGYQVTGMGTASVTVTNVGAAQGRGISHIDYYLSDSMPLYGSISGMKFEDLNGDSLKNGADAGLAGWVMELDNDDDASNGIITTATTDASGSFSFSGLDAGTYYVREVQQSGWTQTRGGPLASGAYTVTVVAGEDSGGVNFGNFENVIISGHKFYDVNVNGLDDDGMVVAGLKVGLDTNGDGTFDYFTYTDASGNYVFGDLDNADGDGNALTGSDLGPNKTYVVKEILPASGWIQTFGQDGYSITTGGMGMQSGGVSSDNDFGNVALGAGGGHTIGYWSNKNGQAVMMDGGTASTELALLNSLDLTKASGADADFASYKDFRTWLLNATAVNMQYMLSAQLAAMQLNVESGFVSGSSLVYAPGLGTGGSDFISVNDLMKAANNALNLDPAANRDYLESLKNALDAANNNLSFVLQTPPPVVYV